MSTPLLKQASQPMYTIRTVRGSYGNRVTPKETWPVWSKLVQASALEGDPAGQFEESLRREIETLTRLRTGLDPVAVFRAFTRRRAERNGAEVRRWRFEFLSSASDDHDTLRFHGTIGELDVTGDLVVGHESLAVEISAPMNFYNGDVTRILGVHEIWSFGRAEPSSSSALKEYLATLTTERRQAERFQAHG